MHYNTDVGHKDVNMFCDTTQFTSLQFCGPHTKPNDVIGFRNNYHMQVYTKIEHGIWAIFQILCTRA